MKAQIGMYTHEDRLKLLSKMGDPLVGIKERVDFEIFRPQLNRVMKKAERAAGGRPPYDYVLMFKILLLQQWNNLSDDSIEFYINDRLSYQRFLGLTPEDKVPDAKTVWWFRERLKTTGAMKDLFDHFNACLAQMGLITRSGSIVDATFVDVPRQRNTKQENATIAQGQIPQEWQKPESHAKLAQKDVDARWAKKHDETHYGYKDHVKADNCSKLIVEYVVGDAAEHDSQALEELLDEHDKVLYADSAYVGELLHNRIHRRHPNLEVKIHEKGCCNHPLTQEQKASNCDKSRIRCRIEHIFGYMTNTMGGINIRSIGYERAQVNIGLKNLAYNIRRAVYLCISTRKKDYVRCIG